MTREPHFYDNWRQETGFDNTEIMMLASELFLQDMSAAKIVSIVKETYGIKISPKAPKKFFRQAAKLGYVHLQAPGFLQMQSKWIKKFGWLEELEVVHSIFNRHVSETGARALRKLVKQLASGPQKRNTVHIGWGGGLQIKEFAACFVRLMNEEPEGWPETIYIHGMVSGVQFEDPTLNPAFIFMEQLIECEEARVELKFVHFPGPVLVDSAQIDVNGLQASPYTRKAQTEAEKLDVIVTSAANWTHDHSGFRQGMKSSQADCKLLENEGIMGDFLLRPINMKGPVDIETVVRFWTLMELNQLPGFITNGGKVMLLLGPCNECGLPKTQVLMALLAHKKHLITHLIVDSRTVRETELAWAKSGIN